MNITTIRHVIIFSLCVCALSCVSTAGTAPYVPDTRSMQEQSESGYWVSRPSGNELIIIGVSSIMAKRDTELDTAKQDAARKASMFNGVQGVIETFSRSGSAGFFDSVNASSIDLSYDTNYQNYISNLKFDPEKDVLRTNDAVFVRFRYSAAVDSIQYNSGKDSKGRPYWTSHRELPQINGYRTVVALAQRQSRLKDTIIKSADAAIAGLIQDMSTQVHATDYSQSKGGTSGTISTRSEGKLDKFMILEFWIEPETMNVYTLAAARQLK